MRGCTREGTGGNVRRSRLARKCLASTSGRITGTLAQDHKLQRQGRKRRNSSELFSRQNNFTEKCTMFFRPAGLQRSGSASRAREVTPWHGGQTPVGGRFHELNRTLPAHSGSRPPFTTGGTVTLCLAGGRLSWPDRADVVVMGKTKQKPTSIMLEGSRMILRMKKSHLVLGSVFILIIGIFLLYSLGIFQGKPPRPSYAGVLDTEESFFSRPKVSSFKFNDDVGDASLSIESALNSVFDGVDAPLLKRRSSLESDSVGAVSSVKQNRVLPKNADHASTKPSPASNRTVAAWLSDLKIAAWKQEWRTSVTTGATPLTQNRIQHQGKHGFACT